MGVVASGAAGSTKIDAAQKFISWATSKHYTRLVASKEGWPHVPPGTRTSLYKNPDYVKAAPFAQDDARLDQLGRPDASDGEAGSLHRRSVRGDPGIPGHRDDVGQDFSAALAGTMTVDAALAKAQASTEAAMKKAGYIK